MVKTYDCCTVCEDAEAALNSRGKCAVCSKASRIVAASKAGSSRHTSGNEATENRTIRERAAKPVSEVPKSGSSAVAGRNIGVRGSGKDEGCNTIAAVQVEMRKGLQAMASRQEELALKQDELAQRIDKGVGQMRADMVKLQARLDVILARLDQHGGK